MPWENLCVEVAKLRIELPRDAEVIPLRRAVNDESPGPTATGLTTAVTTLADAPRNALLSLANARAKMVEAPGVEPGSGRDQPKLLRA